MVLSRWCIYDLWRYIHDIFLVLSRAIHLWYVYGAFQSECVVNLWCKIYDDIFLMIHLCGDTFMVLSRASMRYIYDNIFLILMIHLWDDTFIVLSRVSMWYIHDDIFMIFMIHLWDDTFMALSRGSVWYIYDFDDTFMIYEVIHLWWCREGVCDNDPTLPSLLLYSSDRQRIGKPKQSNAIHYNDMQYITIKGNTL